MSGIPEDPKAGDDLTQLPREHLQRWLEAERGVLVDYVYDGIGKTGRAERAAWARARADRIEGELRRRSGRLPGC